MIRRGEEIMRAFEKNIRKVEPYVPGEQPQNKVIKLNTNENPYPPSPKVTEALVKMDTDRFRLYPDPTCGPLVEALAEFYHVDRDQVFVGVGSDDVLSMCFLTFFNSKKPILFPDITYSFYKVWAELYRIPYECQKLDEDFRIVKEDYYKENGGVIFPNPNAPTAIYEELDFVEDIIRANPDVIVIVDEAYIDFAGKPSLAKQAAQSDNAAVVKTFSKSYALAGARCGYAVANEDIVRALMRVKDSFNSYTVNACTQAVALAALTDVAYFTDRVAAVVKTRDAFREKLLAKGYDCPVSSANFLFAVVPDGNGERAYREWKEKGVLVRHWNAPRLYGRVRITVGTDEQMQILESLL